MFRRIFKTVSVVLASMALVVGLAGTSSAAPTQKGHTDVQSGLLNLAEALGILRAEAIAPSTKTGNVFLLPVVVNSQKGTIKHVGGQLLTNLGSQEQLSITNLWQNNDANTVSGIINGGERMTLFTIQPISGTTANLLFTAASAALFNDFVGLPLLSEGTPFGTATQTLTQPGR
jgi:hypothetical protein